MIGEDRAAAKACPDGHISSPETSRAEERAPYDAPQLEQLGTWSALTLTTSESSAGSGFEEGAFLFDPTRFGRLG